MKQLSLKCDQIICKIQMAAKRGYWICWWVKKPGFDRAKVMSADSGTHRVNKIWFQIECLFWKGKNGNVDIFKKKSHEVTKTQEEVIKTFIFLWNCNHRYFLNKLPRRINAIVDKSCQRKLSRHFLLNYFFLEALKLSMYYCTAYCNV